MGTDRNLLFAVLALQADLLDSARFVEACVAWTAQKGRPLADLLVERGWITPADQKVIEHVMELKLKKHGGDVRASLADALDDRARDCLSALGDSDVRQSLATLPQPSGHVLISTLDHTPGTGVRPSPSPLPRPRYAAHTPGRRRPPMPRTPRTCRPLTTRPRDRSSDTVVLPSLPPHRSSAGS